MALCLVHARTDSICLPVTLASCHWAEALLQPDLLSSLTEGSTGRHEVCQLSYPDNLPGSQFCRLQFMTKTLRREVTRLRSHSF